MIDKSKVEKIVFKWLVALMTWQTNNAIKGSEWNFLKTRRIEVNILIMRSMKVDKKFAYVDNIMNISMKDKETEIFSCFNLYFLLWSKKWNHYYYIIDMVCLRVCYIIKKKLNFPSIKWIHTYWITYYTWYHFHRTRLCCCAIRGITS